MAADTFTCAVCGRIEARTTPEDEALAEAERVFGHTIPQEERATVCNDCYAAFMAWYRTLN